MATAFDSILADVEKVDSLIISTITGTAANLSSTVITQAKTAAGATETLIDLLKAMVDMTGPRLGSVALADPDAAIGKIAIPLKLHALYMAAQLRDRGLK